MRYYTLIVWVLLLGACNRHNSIIFRITSYGAVGDSLTLNTQAIQSTIDAAAKKGGGTVLIPTGKYLTGTLYFRSNIHYLFENGAMLIGSPHLKDYNLPEGESNIMLISSRQQALQKFRVLIDASDVENVSISGLGIIDGNGQSFWDKDFLALERPEPWISFINATNVVLRDLQFQNSPSHVLRFENSREVIIDGIKILNNPRSPNTDGIDIVDSQNFSIINSFISTGDDAICLKSNEQFVENVVVTNCIIESDDAAIKFGTGSRTGMRYNSFSNSIIRKSRYGISLFMLEGGLFELNSFSNLIMEGGSRHQHEYPIFIDVDKKRPEDAYGKVRNNSFNDLTISTTGKILITGRPESQIENINFNNVNILISKEADFTGAKKPRGNKNFPKLETSIDNSSHPSFVTLDHISGLSINNMKMTYLNTPTREEIYFGKMENLDITGFKKRSKNVSGK